MNAKVLIAGGGIALTAIIPFATLSKYPDSTQVQTVQGFSDLVSPQVPSIIGNLNPLNGSPGGATKSDDLEGGTSSSRLGVSQPPSLETLDPRIRKSFTPFSDQPKSSVKKPVPFQTLCQKVDGDSADGESFTCIGDSKQTKFSKHDELLAHYLKTNGLSIDISRYPDDSSIEYYPLPNA